MQLPKERVAVPCNDGIARQAGFNGVFHVTGPEQQRVSAHSFEHHVLKLDARDPEFGHTLAGRELIVPLVQQGALLPVHPGICPENAAAEYPACDDQQVRQDLAFIRQQLRFGERFIRPP